MCFFLGWANPGPAFFSDTTLVCNDLVHVSLGDDCAAWITPDMILESPAGPASDYTVSIEDAQGDEVPNPVTGSFLGEILTVTVTENASGNACWGQILPEDKKAPQVFCFDAEIPCFQSPESVPFPPALDNCDPTPDVNLSDQTIDASDPCTAVVIKRWFVAVDDAGNTSAPCLQVLTTVLPDLPDFPEDIIWNCGDYLNFPNVVDPNPVTNNLATTGSGVPDVAVGNYCPYNVSHSDMTLDGCGASFKIIRNWTVFNWCSGEIVTQDINGDDNVQIIDVLDQTAPEISLDSFTVSANISGAHPQECTSQGFLPPPAVEEECGDWTVKIFTPIGEAQYANGTDGLNGGFIPAPGLPLGFHDIAYRATDACGNVRTDTVQIEVVDDIPPTTICDELTEVALTIDGKATVNAATFDDGSHDNCCLDHFEAAFMEDACGTGSDFSPTLTFCCEQVGNAPVSVRVRAYDCAGNYNECMVSVQVTDKINPELFHCPPAQTIDCDFYLSEIEPQLDLNNYVILGQFGNPVFEDNCSVQFIEFTVNRNINPCGEGSLVRHWKVTDPAGNTPVECNQFIFVEHVSDWVVQFPDDVLVTCTDSVPDAGYPAFFRETCELIAVSYEDQVFNVVPDACFKIARTWTIVNWCAVGSDIADVVPESSELELNADLDGDGILEADVFQDGLNTQNFDPAAYLLGAQPDGYITWQQTIKVNDPVAPLVTCPPDLEVCIESGDCAAQVALPAPDVVDCSTQIAMTASGDLGDGPGPFDNVAPGDYSMTWAVADNCGNSSACTFDISVKDCKKPTPYCVNGLVVELGQDAQFELHARDLDAGSFDNCPGDLKLSFTTNVTDTLRILDCFDLGEIIITLWVTDAAGNQDFCETFVFVQDNMGACMGPPLIAGTIENETGQGINQVEVHLNGDPDSVFTTSSDGHFIFENLTLGNDYTVSPTKTVNYLNGVTTYDLVLISRHILGTIQLSSPYKILAADVNQSKSVSTSDLVQIRRLILHLDTAFANSPSWRFMDKDFVFDDPQNPFLNDIPEVLSFNDLADEITDADFIGWKVGDVNNSANPDNLTALGDR
ncbi:MAG: hypothetical protein D6714_09515, partial [Bacteroidetes bacterium]